MLNSKQKVIASIVLIALAATATLFLLAPSTDNLSVNLDKPDSESTVATKLNPTIGTEWQWDQIETGEQVKTKHGISLPFTAESVYIALQAVKLDVDGNIILDHDALISLDETLERIHNSLDSDSLKFLQELIKVALPGKAGEQTASIVADYYQFLEAKDEFSQINEAMADTNNEGSLESVQANQALYAELQDLREVHLGSEATSSLFRISDANAKYMFDSMSLESETSLTYEERNVRRKEIDQRHIEQSINITDWPSRYQVFKRQKQDILSASIDDVEKRKQLKTLLTQHFDSSELKRIKHLGLERL